VARGALQVATGFELERLEATAQGIVAHGADRALAPVDEVVGSTGFRPQLELLSELRLGLDPGTQAPLALAPLIDPNLHSCGSVRPHGAEELRHPEADLYIVGMKSYGRAPTFLLLTGYEQVRSVVAAIAGDWDAARRVELELPETGVCITQFAEEPSAEADCCAAAGGGGAPVAAAACSTTACNAAGAATAAPIAVPRAKTCCPPVPEPAAPRERCCA
jgi:hypothetical protein